MSGDYILLHEASVRGLTFVGVLGFCLIAQWRWPLRGAHGPPGRRLRNFALVLIDSLVLRFVFPMLAVQFAITNAAASFGLLHALPLTMWASVLLTLLLLDIGIYLQHWLMHRSPMLWRLHRVHHSDTVFDVSLGVRFHPLEIVLSMAYKLLLIALIGAPPIAVLIYEVALSAASLFTHTDMTLPLRVQRVLRMLMVTPDMHRIHHSVHREETDSNYGSLLVLWDRLFKTFRNAPRDGQQAMRVGLLEFDESASRSLIGLLLQPFRKPPGPIV